MRKTIGAIITLFGLALTVFGSYSEYWWPSNPCCSPTYSILEAGYVPEVIGFVLIGSGIWSVAAVMKRAALFSLFAGALVLVYGLWLNFAINV